MFIKSWSMRPDSDSESSENVKLLAGTKSHSSPIHSLPISRTGIDDSSPKLFFTRFIREDSQNITSTKHQTNLLAGPTADGFLFISKITNLHTF